MKARPMLPQPQVIVKTCRWCCKSIHLQGQVDGSIPSSEYVVLTRKMGDGREILHFCSESCLAKNCDPR